MNATLTARLTRLQRRPTAYEIVVDCVETGDTENPGKRFLLVYADRWTRRMLINEIGERRDDLERVTGVAPEAWQMGDRVRDPVTGVAADGKIWKIKKTGRTQREAYIMGECEYICDV